MPCNCSGFRISSCRCKLVPGQWLTTPKDFLLVPGVEKTSNGFIYRILEGFYDKCAAYNIRYCPLRQVSRYDKSLTAAGKDFLILICFLLANFVIFLNIITKAAIHFYYVLKETAYWIRSRSKRKTDNCVPVYFEPHSKAHDFKPNKKRFDKIF